MSTRASIHFKEYKQFMDKSVTKQALASVCVYAEQVLGIWDNYEAKIRTIRNSKSYTSLTAVQTDLVKENEELMKTLAPLMEALISKRNSRTDFFGNQLKPLEKWTKTSDIFNNIVEDLKDEQTNEAMEAQMVNKLEEAVEKWKSGYEECKTELNECKRELEWLREKSANQERTLKNAQQNDDVKVENDTYKSVLVRPIPESTKMTSYKIDGKTPIFKSKTEENVENWIYKVETALEFAQVPRNVWLVAVSNYVEGTALEMLKQAREENKSWDMFKKSLLDTFRPLQKDFDLRAKINHLKDRDSFEKYLHEFRSLSNQIPKDKMSDADRLNCFLQGLRAKTRAELFLKDIKELDEAIKVATILESVRKQAGDMKPKLEVNSVDKSRKMKCYKCKLMGHIAANCRVKLNNNIVKNKPYNKDKMVKSSGGSSFKKDFKKNNFARNLKYSKYKCTKCGLNGHTAEYCRDSQKQKVKISTIETELDENLIVNESNLDNDSLVYLNMMEIIKDDDISSDEEEVLKRMVEKAKPSKNSAPEKPKSKNYLKRLAKKEKKWKEREAKELKRKMAKDLFNKEMATLIEAIKNTEVFGRKEDELDLEEIELDALNTVGGDGNPGPGNKKLEIIMPSAIRETCECDFCLKKREIGVKIDKLPPANELRTDVIYSFGADGSITMMPKREMAAIERFSKGHPYEINMMTVANCESHKKLLKIKAKIEEIDCEMWVRHRCHSIGYE